MTAPVGSRWYAVHTHPHAERRASLHLDRQGFSVYLPQLLKRRRHARQLQVVAAPLFPRYMFVAVDLATQRWRCIRSTIGVSGLVCAADQPVALADEIVTQLRRQEDQDGFIRLAAPAFSSGDRIQIVGGVFNTCLGLFEGMSDAERVTVLLDLLGRKVRVAMEAQFVAAA